MLFQAYQSILDVRAKSPLVHNITNYVVMQTTANALLASGASPIMAHAKEEMPELMAIASALVLNIGTLSPAWVEAMEIAGLIAKKRGIPIVLDPVGAGASSYRTKTASYLLEMIRPTIIRGNASEIMVLAGASGITTKGVDSTSSTDEAKEAAILLAERFNCIVSVSGASDLITDGKKNIWIHGGNEMMTKVTGMGCSATALSAAHAAVNQSSFEAAAYAMIHMAVAGSKAAQNSHGSGSFSINFLDELSNISQDDITKYVRIDA